MSRTFPGSGTTNFLSVGVDVLGQMEPCTLAAWFHPDASEGDWRITGLDNSAAASELEWLEISIRGAGAGAAAGTAKAAKRLTAPQHGFAQSGNKIVANQWNHIAGVFSADDARSVILNGDTANKGTDATSIADFTPDTTGIGLRLDASPNAPFDGEPAHVAFWTAALTDAEIVALSQGASPLWIRRASLVAYYPVFGGHSPEIDVVGGNHMTVSGTLPLSGLEPPIAAIGRPVSIVTRTADGNVTSRPTQGNLTLSSVAPTVIATANRTITPGQGNLALSSVAPAVAVTGHHMRAPASANLVLSSVAPAIMIGVNILVPHGDLTLSTVAPTPVISQSLIAKPAAGQLVLTGFAPTIPLSSPRAFGAQTLEAPLYYAGRPQEHRYLIAKAVNQAIRGKTNNVGEVTFTPNSTTTVVKDSRVGRGSYIRLSPLTALAGGEVGYWFSNIGDEVDGVPSFTINHALDSRSGRRFRYAVVG